MKRRYTLKTGKRKKFELMRDKGYTLLEITIVIALIGILSLLGVAGVKTRVIGVEKVGSQIAADMESYNLLEAYGPYSYNMEFDDCGYVVKQLGPVGKAPDSGVIRTIKEVVYPEGIEVRNFPKNLSFSNRGEMSIDKKSMTMEISDKNSSEAIYITVVPVSNRILLTSSPSKAF